MKGMAACPASVQDAASASPALLTCAARNHLPPCVRPATHTRAPRARAMLAKGRQASGGSLEGSFPRPPVLICQLEAARASTVHLNKDLEEVKSSGAAALSETLEDERRYRGLAPAASAPGLGSPAATSALVAALHKSA